MSDSFYEQFKLDKNEIELIEKNINNIFSKANALITDFPILSRTKKEEYNK